MLPPELLVEPDPKPKRVRRWRFRPTSPALNVLTLVSGVLLAWVLAFPTPASRYPLHKTLDVPTERERSLEALTVAKRGEDGKTKEV